jgi:hypothetical protein
VPCVHACVRACVHVLCLCLCLCLCVSARACAQTDRTDAGAADGWLVHVRRVRACVRACVGTEVHRYIGTGWRRREGGDWSGRKGRGEGAREELMDGRMGWGGVGARDEGRGMRDLWVGRVGLGRRGSRLWFGYVWGLEGWLVRGLGRGGLCGSAFSLRDGKAGSVDR